jgi:hypothetical protein
MNDDERITWDYCAPIRLQWYSEPIQDIRLDDEITLAARPSWLHIDWSPQSFDAISESPYALIGSYTTGPIFGGLLGEWARQRAITARCEMVQLAAWCVAASDFTISRALHRVRDDQPNHLHHQVGGAYRLPTIGSPPRLSQSDLGRVALLFAASKRCGPNGTVGTALRMALRALGEREPDIRLVLQWVALEALFGVGTGEQNFKLSTHIALFCGETAEERHRLAKLAKDLYTRRGKVVHGEGRDTLDEEINDCIALEGVVRRALTKILLDENLLAKFEGKAARKSYLAGLVLD